MGFFIRSLKLANMRFLCCVVVRVSDAGKLVISLSGFIMFECGLEDINLRAAKRSGFSGSASEDETKLQIDRLLSHISAQPPRIHKRVRQLEVYPHQRKRATLTSMHV